ncbi:hypothetical protein SLS53_006017 [Cytospora paraplurivora]|uniref:Cytochrome P450 n=1 Tax=Cytospora paraplurivora TaxID=2898453 RepID=A0AAN9U385_9PEZI
MENVDKQIKRDGCAEMRLNWLAFNLDTLADCFFDRGMDLLLNEDQARSWSKTVGAVAVSTPFAKQFPWFIPMASKLPTRILEIMVPEIARILRLRQIQAAEAAEIHSLDLPLVTKTGKRHELYRTILSSSLLDAREKEPGRISQEAFVVLVAGSETTARILSTGSFHILENRERVLTPLWEELTQVMPDPHKRPSVQELERLPWLGWIIPPGTAASMTLRSILLDPKIFEDPETFRPERWLSSNPAVEHISRYLVPFGHGSRMCLGYNTAMAMLYIGFAVFFRRYDFTLHDTFYERDIKIERDCFNGEVSTGSKGIRVKYVDFA